MGNYVRSARIYETPHGDFLVRNIENYGCELHVIDQKEEGCRLPDHWFKVQFVAGFDKPSYAKQHADAWDGMFHYGVKRYIWRQGAKELVFLQEESDGSS